MFVSGWKMLGSYFKIWFVKEDAKLTLTIRRFLGSTEHLIRINSVKWDLDSSGVN